MIFISCEDILPSIHGCLDSQACNYNPDANINNNNCNYYIDCLGQCGGSAIIDCFGECDGSDVIDCFGVCGGTALEDCAGVCSGTSIEDECGVCNGNGVPEGDCDCNGNDVIDCAGQCGGNAVIYDCWNGIVCNSECPTFNSLDIYDIWKQNTNLDPDNNGFYHFDYVPTGNSESDYGTVKYYNEIPYTRTFWESTDSFWVYHQNQWIGTPIIDNSTYNGDDGYGQQLFYIYEPFIGDTLSIYGYICDENFFGDCAQDYLIKDSIFVIIY